jgi:predicted outer membrane repeat protein
MKKSINHFRIVAFLMICGLLSACQKEKNNDSQNGNSVEFAVNIVNKKSALKNALDYNLSDAKKIVLTIQTANGIATQYTNAEIKIYQMNGAFYSQKIILQSGSYKLSSFVLLDSANNTIYAAPLQGSQEAQNVTIALPLSFMVTTNTSTPVNVEVLSTENKTPGDFGLTSFPISEVKVLNFMIAVADKESDRLLTAKLSVTNGSYSHTQMLDSIASNMVTVIDSFKTYTLTIESSGYQFYTYTFSHDSLKIFNATGSHLPLLVELIPSKAIYVDITATGNNTGLSWDNAFPSIQDGINLASSMGGHTVLVAAGTYNENITLAPNVKLFGGYPNGGGIRNIANNASIIKAKGASSTVTIGVGQYMEIDGFTITGANYSGNGGGIHCFGDQQVVRIANCIIEKNYATNGGGVYLGTSSPQFYNCMFRNNTAQYNGGGAYYIPEHSYPAFVNCVFMDNQANSYGGGIYAGDYCNITNTTIYRNTATYGGGIYAGYYYPTIANTIIWGNTTEQISTAYPINITYSCIQNSYSGEGNISGDPLLNADGIHLQSGSSCINMGNNAAPFVQQFDFDMDNRIINRVVDIGADETNF